MISEKVETGNEISLPPMGYVQELAKLCGCDRRTVNNALRKNMKGKKADRVRKMFRAKYCSK